MTFLTQKLMSRFLFMFKVSSRSRSLWSIGFVLICSMKTKLFYNSIRFITDRISTDIFKPLTFIYNNTAEIWHIFVAVCNWQGMYPKLKKNPCKSNMEELKLIKPGLFIKSWYEERCLNCWWLSRWKKFIPVLYTIKLY